MCIFNVKYTSDQFQDYETLKITHIQQLAKKKAELPWIFFTYHISQTHTVKLSQQGFSPRGGFTFSFLFFAHFISFLVNPSIFTLPNPMLLVWETFKKRYCLQ